MTQKLQETECTRCGQPITTTRGFVTQHWDLTPIPHHTARWVALHSRAVLAVTSSADTWYAQVDRDHISLPTHHDRYQTWLAEHRCHHPPIPGTQEPITFPNLVEETSETFDLFNQPTDDLPPY